MEVFDRAEQRRAVVVENLGGGNEVGGAAACAVAVNVWFSLIGSNISATDNTVSNRLLNSVVTADTSITWADEMCWDDGFFGDSNATYLFPNTVLP